MEKMELVEDEHKDDKYHGITIRLTAHEANWLRSSINEMNREYEDPVNGDFDAAENTARKIVSLVEARVNRATEAERQSAPNATLVDSREEVDQFLLERCLDDATIDRLNDSKCGMEIWESFVDDAMEELGVALGDFAESSRDEIRRMVNAAHRAEGRYEAR